MDPIECLRKVRDLISNPDNWCVGMLYIDKGDGHRQHCVVGAMNLVQYGCMHWRPSRDKEGEKAFELLNLACQRLFGDRPELFIPCFAPAGSMAVRVNNVLGHSAIMLALDTAIGDYPDHAPKEPGTAELQCQMV